MDKGRQRQRCEIGNSPFAKNPNDHRSLDSHHFPLDTAVSAPKLAGSGLYIRLHILDSLLSFLIYTNGILWVGKCRIWME